MPKRKRSPAGGETARRAAASRAGHAPSRSAAAAWPDIAAEYDPDRYFDLYNFAPVAYLRLDANGVIEQINRAACSMLGLDLGVLLRRPLVVFVRREERTAFLEHMRRCRQGDGVIETELSLLASDRIVPVRAYSRRTMMDGRVTCWTMLLDMTERERLDQARRQAERDRDFAENQERAARTANQAKDRFIAMLSHELRTPLTPALFAASRLVEADMPEPTRRLAAVIKRNVEVEARLINDLLDVSRIARGRLDLKFEVTDVDRLVRECVDICGPQAAAKHIATKLDLQAASRLVRADPARLRQVFWNLLSNAVKFTDGGRIELRTANDESGAMRVTITDTGVGMDQDRLARLFTPFEQYEGLKSSRGGLGLGLVICKGIVDAHRGQIWATSGGLGEGTTFEVELPTVSEIEAPAPRAQSRPPARRRSEAAAQTRILLVEDDPDTAAVLASVLEGDGYRVEVARTLAQSVALAREGWDIVISDLGLPDGSGLTLAERFKALPVRPRLIALSGYGTEEDRAASDAAGFDEHLVKPVSGEQLRRVLAEPAA